MPQHTYLFKDAVWESSGWYFDKDGNRFAVEGISKINRKTKVWLNDVMLKFLDGPRKDIFSFFEIFPIKEGEHHTTFKSQTPDLGLIQGELSIAGSEIFLKWTAENSHIKGTDHMHMVNDHHYSTDGFILYGEEKVSSWEIQLKRI